MSRNDGRWPLSSCILALALLGGCGGGPTGPNDRPTPTPTPTPAPVTTVVTQGTFTGLRPLVVGFIPFVTSSTGTIAVTIDWTFASNDVDLFLVRGTNPCTVAQFNNNTCPFLAVADSVATKPERVSVANLAAGPYTFYAINFGTSDESIAYQVTLTSVPGASAFDAPAKTGGAAKGRLKGAIGPG